jgi:hypothetical protein
MTDVLHQQVDLGEVSLHVTTAGTGDPVVLLHGWPQTSHEWRNIIPALADRYRVIAPLLATLCHRQMAVLRTRPFAYSGGLRGAAEANENGV